MSSYQYDGYPSSRNRHPHHNGYGSSVPKFEILDLEIDQGCMQDACLSLPCQHGTKPPFELYKYHEVPHFLQGNPYVVGGYRGLMPLGCCIKR